MKRNNFKKFIFFSAGPVGDHVILIDFANRFFVSTGIPSTIIMKHPNQFLADFNIPYQNHISYIYFKGTSGILQMAILTFESIFTRNCFVNVLPIPAPRYYKLFAYFIRFFTRSRFVGFNLESSRNFPKGNGSSSFLGKENYIDAQIDKNLFYQEANRMLKFLGFKEIDTLPIIEYINHSEVLTRNNLKENNYLVFHLCSSHPDRSLPTDRWNKIIKEIRNKLPNVKFIFTGAKVDEDFIKEALNSISGENILLCGVLKTQELLTLHAKAKLNVTVHTGNMHFINMLHVPTININIKGIYFFKPYYNEKQIELVSKEGCTCDPYERQCSMVNHKRVEYMACLFSIKDEDIIDVVVTKYYKND
jgi:ADP-heptose:LPS heptosyltransferase